ncbi:MAG TPA: ATP-binding protein [Candidatus Aenigmarchaeota archaeon]|nr:ATP-binding protein [Candidatus Aenigmarchaeota archaeon]
MDKYLIKHILLEQKREIVEIFKDKIIEREIFPQVKETINSDLIKVIMGVRRCGKSVLAHQLLKDKTYGYINFDDERLIGVKTSNLNDFLEALKEIECNFRYLLLDEIQNIYGWELFVNRLKRSSCNIIVTGSNSKMLSRELATHLTGRHLNITLFPFSFREFLKYKDFSVKENDFYITEKKARIKSLLEEYLKWGGFPEVHKINAKGNYLRELFDKIITQDIILRYNIKYIKDLKEIALYSISNFGCPVTYHKVKNIFEMKSIHTIKNYFNYLEEAYLIFQLEPFSFKFKEQIKKPRKIYCIDTGLTNALLPKTTSDYGRLMENLVFLELKRRYRSMYYYSQSGYEVDFLLKESLKIKQLIQVCFSLTKEDTKKREIRALLKSSQKFNCNDLLIITWDQEGIEEIGSRKIKVLPLWKWLLFE